MPFRSKFAHRLQASRFEFKYVVDEGLAVRIRHFLGTNLEPDEHAQLRAWPLLPNCPKARFGYEKTRRLATTGSSRRKW